MYCTMCSTGHCDTYVHAYAYIQLDAACVYKVREWSARVCTVLCVLYIMMHTCIYMCVRTTYVGCCLCVR